MSGEPFLAAPLAALFSTTSRLRGARTFHPRGVTYAATWEPDDPARLPAGAALATVRPAVVRLSHAVGLPPAAPDILGLVVRLPDAHGAGRPQDLLFASSGSGRLRRRMLLPARRLETLTTLLPYEVAGLGRGPLVAQVREPVPYAHLAVGGQAVPGIEVRFASEAGPLLGTLMGGDAPTGDDEGLCFDPWNTGPELQPVGWLNRLRGPAYAASQRGRGQRPSEPPRV